MQHWWFVFLIPIFGAYIGRHLNNPQGVGWIAWVISALFSFLLIHHHRWVNRDVDGAIYLIMATSVFGYFLVDVSRGLRTGLPRAVSANTQALLKPKYVGIAIGVGLLCLIGQNPKQYEPLITQLLMLAILVWGFKIILKRIKFW